jgi:hypothetical protein
VPLFSHTNSSYKIARRLVLAPVKTSAVIL